MPNMMNNKIPLLLLLLLSQCFIYAQQRDVQAEGSASLVTNPAYFILGGYHIKPSWHFPQNWSVGITAQGGFELPGFARDQFFEISSDAIDVDWDYAVGVALKYRFSAAPYDKGLYTSASLGYEAWTILATETQSTFENWFASIDLGYNWYPLRKQRLHLGLAYTLIFILNNTDEQSIASEQYRLRSLVPPTFAPSIFLGWRF